MSILDRISKKKQEPAAAKKKTAKAEGEKENVSATVSPIRAGVLKYPVVSEKAVHQEAAGTYTFAVDKKANKTHVKQAIKTAYGVLPTDVRMVNVQGKKTRFGRSAGRRSDWKKAIVTLPKGKTISVHEGV